jgi:outer membrane protein OmpU
MNNLKKIGLTALAGSLVAVSANAGEMSVSGSFNATYSTQSGNTGTTATDHGIGLGTDKDFTVSGSGELDNGWTFSGYTLTKDDLTVSSSALSMTMGSIGTFTIGHGFGGSSTKYDVQTPTAYEEVDDGGATSISANFVGSWADNNSVVYNSPSFDMNGGTVSFDVEYSPEATGTSPADGGTVVSTAYGSGMSLGVTMGYEGLTVGVYGATRDNETVAANSGNNTSDEFNGVWYANYSYGPVSVGYSQSYHDAGLGVASSAATAAKVTAVAGGIFEAEQMSIAFNVNDNLSLSYAKSEDVYDAQSHNLSGTETADVTMDYKSIQAAYSMGAMSIKAYRTETDNVAYNTSGGSLTVTEVALGLSF